MTDKDGIDFRARHLLVALVVIGLAGAAAGAGTFALFQDTESSTGNSVQAGTMDLGIHNNGSMQWDIHAAEPGVIEPESQDIHIENTGSIRGDHLEIDFRNYEMEDNDHNPSSLASGPESDTMNDSAEGMARYIRVEEMTYEPEFADSQTLVYSAESRHVSGHNITDANGNGYIDLADLANETNDDALDGFTPPQLNQDNSITFHMQILVDESMPNDYQGDITNTTVTFALHQEAGQDIENETAS